MNSISRKIVITVNDFDRLSGLPGVPNASRLPETVRSLRQTLEYAKKTSPEDIQEGIVTMNSRVLVREVNLNRESEITLVYPHDAAHGSRRISVLSPIGLALLGRREKDVVSWKVPSGTGSFEIVKVTYQPEAAGHYHL